MLLSCESSAAVELELAAWYDVPVKPAEANCPVTDCKRPERPLTIVPFKKNLFIK